MTHPRALEPRIALALVIAASLYTAALCLLHTRVMGVSNTLVAVVDGAILLSALALALWRGPKWLWLILGAIAVNFLALALFRVGFDAKVVRDPLVLITFGALGWRYGTFERARAAFFVIASFVLAFAALEWAAPDAYTSLFNVIQFYAARGMVDADTLQRLDSAFFISGARDGERLLLPGLGPHRASSIFLEPVSMGNFGALALVFALSLDRARWRTALAAGIVGFVVIVLADARFASTLALFLLVARMMPSTWTRVSLALLPLLAVGMLFAFAYSSVGHGDDLPTRLAGSGRTLLDMGPAALFGLGQYEISTFDAGYAYAFSSFGLPFCVMLWLLFVATPAATREGQRYKLLLGVYICALLCISGTSLFAMKTAALGFFTFGALAAQREATPAPKRRRRARVAQPAPA